MSHVMSIEPNPPAPLLALQRAALAPEPADPRQQEPGDLERRFAAAEPAELLAWAAAAFGDRLVMSTSFGIQSAAMLHLATRQVRDIPVLWVDTGYLPAETYRFADELTERLGLNRIVVQSPLSPARMETLYGRLWESQDGADVDRYDRIRKVEPMRRALQDLGAEAWVSGIRAEQTRHRDSLPRIDRQDGRFKVSPILRWTTRQVHEYLKAHDLPYHPLFEQGYATVGDWHSSRALGDADTHERDTRFGGRKQECGLHLSDEASESLESSQL